jgi:hypothetical protein
LRLLTDFSSLNPQQSANLRRAQTASDRNHNGSWSPKNWNALMQFLSGRETSCISDAVWAGLRAGCRRRYCAPARWPGKELVGKICVSCHDWQLPQGALHQRRVDDSATTWCSAALGTPAGM